MSIERIRIRSTEIMSMKPLNLLGQRFGRLVVTSEAPKVRRRRYFCACDCGAQTTASVDLLRTGKKRSCGCLLQENRGSAARTHGGSTTREYRIWYDMKRRCEQPKNKSYPYYGGRGIKVCERWTASFAAFLLDMGPSNGLTIDRIDPNGDYEPRNCRWATRALQTQNRRTTRGSVQ